MSEKKTQKTEQPQTDDERKPYDAPDVESSDAFERHSLSCTTRLNMTPAFPARCALQS